MSHLYTTLASVLRGVFYKDDLEETPTLTASQVVCIIVSAMITIWVIE